MDKEKEAAASAEPEAKRKGGRKPLTAEEKAAAAKARAESKAKAELLQPTDLKLYVKPEERTAYYVVNEKYTGSVSY